MIMLVVLFQCYPPRPRFVTLRVGFSYIPGATALAALMLAFHPALGWLYLIPVGVVTIDLMIRNIRLLSQPDGRQASFTI